MSDWEGKAREETSALPERGVSLEVKLRALAGIFALHDVILLVYLAILGVLVLRAEPGPEQVYGGRVIYVSITALTLGCFISRGITDLSESFRARLYRVIVVGVLISNYLTLRDILPLIRLDSLDEVLLKIDIRLFGVEPTLWLERYNQRPIVEWFSFFYFSYFFIDTIYMLTVIWFSKPGRRTTEFAIGTALVFAIGQLGYTAVPGYGPIHHLKDVFHADVNGGFFWSCVWRTVQAGGAMKDIFPSLHTAVPLWFALFARHQAKTDPRWRWAAWVTAFFSVNIIISTLLLRWHYAIDVMAGLCLAFTVGFITPRLAALEDTWRRSLGHGEPWSFAPPEDRGST